MKFLYVATLSETINAFLIPHIKMLVSLGHTVDIACCVKTPIDDQLYECGCQVYEISFSRTPFKLTNYFAYKKLETIINKEKYDIVHTHTPVASAIVRLVCKNNEKIKVYYTAHGFHFFQGAPFKNWFIYYPLEKWLSNYTDTLITINQEDYQRAKKRLNAKKAEYIPGIGLDIKKINNSIVDIKNKREELYLPKDAFIVLSVGELNENKNHEVIIRAIAQLNNNKIYYLICGEGHLEEKLKKLAIQLGIQNNVFLLGYRKDVVELCKSSDVFAFPSKREGLGMASLEAMACGLPLITSNIRGVTDYSKNGVTGFIAAPDDIDQFAKYIDYLLRNPVVRISMGEKNQNRLDKYLINNCLDRMYEIYSLQQR